MDSSYAFISFMGVVRTHITSASVRRVAFACSRFHRNRIGLGIENLGSYVLENDTCVGYCDHFHYYYCSTLDHVREYYWLVIVSAYADTRCNTSSGRWPWESSCLCNKSRCNIHQWFSMWFNTMNFSRSSVIHESFQQLYLPYKLVPWRGHQLKG